MPAPLLFLSIPGLRRQDLGRMPHVQALASGAELRQLDHSFPAVTWPAQATMLTGCLPRQHGIVANGMFDRAQHKLEMWTFGNEAIEQPQLWDTLRQAGKTTAAWFPMLSKRCGADYVCMPAPVHNPDGSESLWCYTKPAALYGELQAARGHFPLQHFWGPLANLKSSQWILDSAVLLARQAQPDFFYLYVPHLDYAAQKMGPDSPAAWAAVAELDQALGVFGQHIAEAYGQPCAWLIASEYVIVPTNHVSFPNRVLREHGWLQVIEGSDGEMLDLVGSRAWALVDHQFSHVYVREPAAPTLATIADVLRQQPGVAAVWDRGQQAQAGLDHPRSGDLIVLSEPHSWQAYYYWLDERRAPAFARTVDIHRKPGYDPIELHFDFATKSIPLDASLNRGSHGVITDESQRQSVVLLPGSLASASPAIRDVELYSLVLRHFGVVGAS